MCVLLGFQEICRLYRNSLKLLDSWAVDRNVFNSEATAMRKMVGDPPAPSRDNIFRDAVFETMRRYRMVSPCVLEVERC